MQICIERGEQEGIVNTRPVTIASASGVTVIMTGGQAACIFLPVGRAALALSFAYPYAGPSDMPETWTTDPYSIEGASGELIHLELCEAADDQRDDPTWSVTGWHRMWLLRPVGDKSAGACSGDR